MSNMSARPYQSQDRLDRELRTELVGHLHLSPEDVERIYESMQSSGLGFGEAALQLGLITESELQSALTRATAAVKPQQESTSLVETAIKRIASDRQLILRLGSPVTPSNLLLQAHDNDSPRAERLRALRTELLLLNEGVRGANVVAILSPCSGEGRSQLCAELAISFAQLGRSTLLVDADMRKPTQHLLFPSGNEYGLSQAVLRNDRSYYHTVTGLQHLHVLTAGPRPQNPLELLSDGRFDVLLTTWRKQYEFIVIDTPPVTQCADGVAVATLAGRVLVLSRAQHTSYASTRELLRRLATTRSNILGAVVNHF